MALTRRRLYESESEGGDAIDSPRTPTPHLVGVGVVLAAGKDGQVVIRRLEEGSAAARTGVISVGDIVYPQHLQSLT